MLRAVDRRIACELRRRLSVIAPILDLRVFGSWARGDAAPDSDLDLFIELEEAPPELRQRISEIAWIDKVLPLDIINLYQIQRSERWLRR
jgi:predicted nucleotidyltransferase